MAKSIQLDKLASELFSDITQSEMSLSVWWNVMAQLFPNKELERHFSGFHWHLYQATATHSFMMVSRMFDEPVGRFSVTLEELVGRVGREKKEQPHVQSAVATYRARVQGMRKKLTKVRNTVFAHRAVYPGPRPKMEWGDLRDASTLAKEILDWYGREFGHAYNYRVPGFELDCSNYVGAQLRLAVSLSKSSESRRYLQQSSDQVTGRPPV